MAMDQRLRTEDGQSLAYVRIRGRAPGLVFLGGFKSDMTGTKAMRLEAFARARGQAFLRFDYRGHGASSGDFADATIGAWAGDAIAALDRLTSGPQILVGSSMGGWMMLLAALARPARVAGLIGIAAAPDFTEDLIWNAYPEAVRAQLRRDGLWHEPSIYGAEPYVITLKLIEEGRRHLLLRDTVALDCPLRLLHGTADPDVPWEHALRLLQRYRGTDATLTLVKDGDHRLSREEDLVRLEAVAAELSDRISASPSR